VITTKDREPKVGETFFRYIDGEIYRLKRINNAYVKIIDNRTGPGFAVIGSITHYTNVKDWFSIADFIIEGTNKIFLEEEML
jgi:hypothetical protein